MAGAEIRWDSLRGVRHDSCLFAASPSDEFLDSERFVALAGRRIEWAVEGRVPIGGVTLIVAREKCGKSSFALALARSVARGESFIGAKTKKGRVIYAAFEGSRQGWAERIEALGFKPEDDFLFRLGEQPPDYSRWLQRTISELNPTLVIVDVLARCTSADDLSTYGIATRVMRPFIECARNQHCAIMVLHHARKGLQGETEQEMSLDDVSGSTALAASADTIFLMKRASDGTRYLRSIQRDGTDLEPVPLQYNIVTREFLGHGLRGAPESDTMESFLKGLP